jgi:hypothetical protein
MITEKAATEFSKLQQSLFESFEKEVGEEGARGATAIISNVCYKGEDGEEHVSLYVLGQSGELLALMARVIVEISEGNNVEIEEVVRQLARNIAMEKIGRDRESQK